MTKTWSRQIPSTVLAVLMASQVAAQEAAPAAPEPAPAAPLREVEEIIVTGSYIRGTPENAALPVDVTSFADLQEQGAPSVAELIRNLAYTSGNLAETNQFNAGGGGQAQEGVLTVNLRGLGSARTLVLINGRRLAPGEAIGSDLSILPKSAIGRLEVLKDGAAALYGSDAIGGVANFITRENFEGFEINVSEQFIRKSGGDHEVALIGGWGNDSLHLMAAFEWSHRGRLRFRERDWGLLPEPTNPQGGWSSIGNPARILPASSTGTILGAGAPDPNCALLGGAVVGPSCRFQYTYFDNLVEQQDAYKAYVEGNYEFSGVTKLHVEAIYGLMDMPHWNSSPSYPPQSLFGPDRFVAPTHPGLIDFKAQNPTFFNAVGPFTAASQGAYPLFRALGSSGRNGGGPLTAKRRTEQWRAVAHLSGEIFDGIGWETAITYASRERLLDGSDMYVERMAFALDGLGGPNCTASTGTPGAGGCQYFNPFSNAIQRSAINGAVNPQYNPAVANSLELEKWLFGQSASTTTNNLLVWDGVVSGQIPWFSLPGGEIGWAGGVQVRREEYDLQLIDLTNVAVNPCQFNDPFSVTIGNISLANFNACQNPAPGFAPTGPYAFLSGTREAHEQGVIYGIFGELSLPFFDTLSAQFALRFEDYGGRVGSTIDPKLSLQWSPLEWLSFRGSVSTTFRGPPQSFLSNRVTSLQFIVPANAFKAVDIIGNPNLKPESALTSNVGAIFEWEGLYASIDYWRFDFTDPFQTESNGQIVGAYAALGCQNGGAGELTPTCQGLRAHVFPTGTTAAALQRVDTNIINGSDILTSGIDYYVQYEFADVFGGVLTLGSTGSYRLEYVSDDFVDIVGVPLAVGGDFNGLLNDNTSPFTPLPELKIDVFTKFSHGNHTMQVVGHYIPEYTDVCPPMVGGLACTNPVAVPLNGLDKIDSFFLLDMHYVVRLFDESTALSFSILNVTDEDPPLAATDLNYDPFTHEGRGRMFKVGLTYTWQPK